MKFGDYNWNHHGKCIQASTNMPIGWVSCEIAFETFRIFKKTKTILLGETNGCIQTVNRQIQAVTYLCPPGPQTKDTGEAQRKQGAGKRWTVKWMGRKKRGISERVKRMSQSQPWWCAQLPLVCVYTVSMGWVPITFWSCPGGGGGFALHIGGVECAVWILDFKGDRIEKY